MIKDINIAITGSSGFIGRSLIDLFKSDPIISSKYRIHIYKIIRTRAKFPDELFLNTKDCILCDYQQKKSTTVLDVVFHLAGENISQFPWTFKKKQKIYQSRVHYSQSLIKTLENLPALPKILFATSAIGIYGNQKKETFDEDSPVEKTKGTKRDTFLAKVCRDWEKAVLSQQFSTINMRMGLVLDPRGGALQSMLTPFRLGLGGKLGDGKQMMSWIALSDLLGAMRYLLKQYLQSTEENNITTKAITTGPVNMVSPFPIDNHHFTRLLARVLKRPAIFSQPRWMVELLLGQMGREVLLSGVKVHPKRLLEHSFIFKYSKIEDYFFHTKL